jgi:class 3 adenylate cyclase/predicted ATPase
MSTDLASWLQTLGLERYGDLFATHEVDLDALRLLSEHDLQELGLPLGPRRKITRAIADLRDGAAQGVPRQSFGHQAHSEGERRQLTVLFCDLVGYTELASRLDPEILQGIVRSYEDACAACVTRYEGYVFQRLGDGIVAFFGYPLAHEGEAERAICAGLEILDSLAKLKLPDAGQLRVRIGIATGLVVVSSAEKGAVGETMNLAARLQAIAQPGSIVVSERVHRLAGGTFDYEDLGKQTLKGIGQPTHVYRIVGVSQAASRFDAATGESLTPLVGREQELGLLQERWALAQDGEGQVVLLSGEPGIGKSRILSALRERLEAQGAQALRFQCSPYYVNSAFWPSIDNFERALKFPRDESPESKLDKLEALMVTHYGRPRSDVRFVASLLSIPCEQRYGAVSMTPQRFKDETLRTLVDLTEAAARKQPSVMLFEDAHWADPTTLEVLDLMIDRVKGFPLLIVLTHRPEFESRWSRHGHVAAVNLSKLTRAQSTAMVSRITGGRSLPAELLEQIIVKTDGVPLFVEELTKSILESGELKELDDHYEYAGSARTITIPATLRDSLMARLDRYAPVKEIAQIGAAIGREFSYELIAAIAPMTPVHLDNALTQLTDSGLAFRRGTPPDASYTFKHALVQDAAYDSLLKSRRQELHAKIARVIEEHFPATKDTEPEVLAHHLTAAGLAEAAIPLWQTAGTLALRRMALNEAIAHLNTGLELLATLPASQHRDANELGLRTTLGTAWLALGGWTAPEVWTSLHPALALAKSLKRNDALVPILRGLFSYVLCVGRVAESLPWVQEMLSIAQATGDPDLLIVGHEIACSCYFWMGRLTEAVNHANQVQALYDGEKHGHLAGITNHDPKTVTGHEASKCMWMLGYPDRAVRLFREAEAHAHRRAHPFDLGLLLTIGAEVFDHRGEPDELRKRAAECERLGRENSMPVLWALLPPIVDGRVLIRAGKLAEGIARLEAGMAGMGAGGAKLYNPYLKAVLAEGMALNGDLDNALRLIEEQIEQVERLGWGERLHYAEILRLKGWMLSLKGDLAGAEKNYLASLDWAREQQAKSWELRTSMSLARLWQRQGRRKEAHELLAPVYGWFTEGFDTKDLKEAKALLDDL